MLVHQLTVYSSGHLVVGLVSDILDDITYLVFSLSVVQGLCFLLYPLFGILAEVYWTRYRTIIAGTLIQFVGSMLLTATSFVIIFKYNIGIFIYIIVVLSYATIQLGLALIESNAIQFGTDQMPEASSSQLSQFIHWYFWAIFVGHGVISLLTLLLQLQWSNPESLGIVLIFSCLSQLVCTVIALSIVLSKHAHFEVEPVGQNPFKTIKEVLSYTLHNPVPVKRSAFTYSDEQVSRLDYAKTRFGGPFTTETVENVKTFFRITLVFVGLFGFRLTDETTTISGHLKIFAQTSNTFRSTNVWFEFLTSDCFGSSTFMILIGIPLYQVLIKHKFFLPSMLKRMFLGLLCTLIATIIIQILEILIAKNYAECGTCEYSERHCNFSNGTDINLPFNYNYLLIPQLLNGLSFLLVFLTVMEFILAQGPRSMQGFLIGIWYSMQFINLLILATESFTIVSCQFYLPGIKVGLMLLGVPLYIYIAINYKRRTREENSNVNVTTIIEDYYDRQLRNETKFMSEDEETYIIHSASDYEAINT